MINFLKSYWNKLVSTEVYKTTEIIVLMEQTLDSFEASAGPVLEQINLAVSSTEHSKDYVKAAKQLGFDAKNPKKLLNHISDDYSLIYSTMLRLKDIVKKELPTMMTQNTLTVKQSAILEYTERLNVLVSTYPKLLMYMTYRVNNDKEMIFKKGFSKTLSLSIPYQVEIKALKENGKRILDGIADLSDTELAGTIPEVNSLASKFDKGFPIKESKFVTTWIYNIGKWRADIQIERLEIAKYEKKLTELKLLELSEKEATGNVSSAISKQIEYYEEKLQKLNRRIEELADVD